MGFVYIFADMVMHRYRVRIIYKYIVRTSRLEYIASYVGFSGWLYIAFCTDIGGTFLPPTTKRPSTMLHNISKWKGILYRVFLLCVSLCLHRHTYVYSFVSMLPHMKNGIFSWHKLLNVNCYLCLY